MSRRPRPWFREGRGWYAQIEGKQRFLAHDKNEAYDRFHELMSHRPSPTISGDQVAVVLDLFLDWTEQHRAPRTYDWYRERLQWFLGSIPGSLQVSQLRPYHVQQWVDAHRGWSNTHKRGCITAVKRAFSWAQKMGYIEMSPVAHIEKPRAAQRDTVITQDEYDKILAEVADREFRDLLTASWETGCRPQELRAVGARHVDLGNSRWVFPPKESKGGKRPRVIYLTDTAEAITRRRMLKCPEGPMFRNTKGRPWHPYAVNCRFERLKKKLGRKYCQYLFRHSFATRMLEAGLDALTVAILLGHQNPAMLSATYQHLAHNPNFLAEQLRRASA